MSLSLSAAFSQVNDYEEDNPHYGVEAVGRISANLTARQMGLEDSPAEYNTISPLVITPHCHAPSCIRQVDLSTHRPLPRLVCRSCGTPTRTRSSAT